MNTGSPKLKRGQFREAANYPIHSKHLNTSPCEYHLIPVFSS